MHYLNWLTYALAAGSLTAISALPAGVLKDGCISSVPTKTVVSVSTLVARQDWSRASTTSDLGWSSSPDPVGMNEPSQRIVDTPAFGPSYTNMPEPTTTPPSQDNMTYPKDHFGSRSMLVAFGVVGVIVIIVTIWAIIAHRNGRRPLACFGGLCGRKKDLESARSGSTDSNIYLVGAGRHYDRRPVSTQPQPISIPVPQVPAPARHQIPRRPLAEPEWARQF